MASAYISEYSTSGPQPGNVTAQAPKEPSLAEQLISIAGSTTQSSPFQTNTRLVRINVDSVCSIAFGPNPVAVTSQKRMAANQTEYFSVNGGDRVAVITNV